MEKAMKLIKINTDHYIIVDDSDIKEGDYTLYSGDIFTVKESNKDFIWLNNQNMTCEIGVNTSQYKLIQKITHSTQPFEEGATIHGVEHKRWVQIKYIDLDEVKELIGEVDVEKIAERKYPKSEFWVGSNPSRLYDENAKERRCFIEGYNQALEDNKEKKYTEEDMEAAVCFGMILERFKDDKYKLSDNEEYKGFISSLKPETEWEIEIINGQLKLK